jgi:hypothetical protein
VPESVSLVKRSRRNDSPLGQAQTLSSREEHGPRAGMEPYEAIARHVLPETCNPPELRPAKGEQSFVA